MYFSNRKLTKIQLEFLSMFLKKLLAKFIILETTFCSVTIIFSRSRKKAHAFLVPYSAFVFTMTH